MNANLPMEEAPPYPDVMRAAVAKLKGGEAAGVCNICTELFKAAGEARNRGLHVVLTAVGQSGTIPFEWRRVFAFPLRN